MRYLLSVNRSHIGKLPKNATPTQWARFNDAFTPMELTPREIADEIRAGHAIAAIHAGRRKRDNWRKAQHIGIDLDDGALSWDELVHMPLVEDCAAMVHTTASHRPDAPRYRVLFLLEEPIEHPDEYAYVVGCFLRAFKTADPLCKDASRLFYGAPGCELLLQPDNVVTDEDIANIVTAWPGLDEPIEEPAPRNIGFKPSAQRSLPGDIVSPHEISPARLKAHIDALLDNIRYAPDGTKWATLRDIARTMGGYAASGYYSHDDARGWLRDAIGTRRATVASMPAAYQTIDEALSYGALSPLHYTARDDHAQAHAPTETAGALRARLIAARIAELERQIIAAPDINAPGFDALAIEYAALSDAMRDLG